MRRRPAIPTLSIRPRENVARGILYACASMALSAVMSVGIKWLSDLYPAVELTFFSSLFGFLPVLVFIRRGSGAFGGAAEAQGVAGGGLNAPRGALLLLDPLDGADLVVFLQPDDAHPLRGAARRSCGRERRRIAAHS